jgi:hypothetical protein
MKEFIQPQYDSFDVITFWDEGDGRWAKELAVHIIDETEGTKKWPWSIDRRTVGEDFYIIVCSPPFHGRPNKEVDRDDLVRAIIMEEFSEDKISADLAGKINPIGKVTLDEFEKRFEQYFSMSDWRA